MDEILNSKQVAELIGCSYSQVVLLAESGLLAHFSVGSAKRKFRRYRRSAVDRFIESQEARSIVPAPDPIQPVPRAGDRPLKSGHLTIGILKLLDEKRAREQVP